MSPPKLNRALTLESLVQVPDGAGGFTSSWSPVGTLWCEVKPGAGTDPSAIEFKLSSVPYRITVRGAPVGSSRRPVPEQRLRDGDRAFQITAVTERDSDGLYLTCFTREEVPQ